MLEMEKLLGDIEKLKKLNKILVDEVVECRKGKKFGVVGSDEYRFLIDMVVKNEMEFEGRLWSFRKLAQLRGSFEHECFFYFLFPKCFVLRNYALMVRLLVEGVWVLLVMICMLQLKLL